VDGLKEQLAYIRKLQMDVAWVNYVHEILGRSNTKAAARQKHLLLDLSDREEPVDVSEIDCISPRVAKAYAGMNPRTWVRDVEILGERKLVIREGKTIRANKALISQFLPIRADCPAMRNTPLSTSDSSSVLPPPSVRSHASLTTKAV
jgi:hypothetical protein